MPDEASFALADGTVVRPSRPFFVTGSGRCGTTLTRRRLIERAHAVIPPENYGLAASAGFLPQAGTD